MSDLTILSILGPPLAFFNCKQLIKKKKVLDFFLEIHSIDAALSIRRKK